MSNDMLPPLEDRYFESFFKHWNGRVMPNTQTFNDGNILSYFQISMLFTIYASKLRDLWAINLDPLTKGIAETLLEEYPLDFSAKEIAVIAEVATSIPLDRASKRKMLLNDYVKNALIKYTEYKDDHQYY